VILKHRRKIIHDDRVRFDYAPDAASSFLNTSIQKFGKMRTGEFVALATGPDEPLLERE